MNFDLKFYFSLFMRRLPVMLTLFLICAALGVATAINQEPSYETTAQLLVEDAQIDLNSTSELGATEQLQIIERRLLTRANLIDIANKYSVFADMQEMTPDLIVAEMLEATRIRKTSGRNSATLMSISFEARSGTIAASVVNEYLTIIQRDNSSASVSQVEDALAFFQQEVDRLSQDLDLQSAKIVEFKDQNARALPDDLEFRYGRQTLLQERLTRLDRERTEAEAKKAEIVRLFQTTGRVSNATERQLTQEEQQLQALQLELQRARAVYSDTNPKVVLLQNQVSQLEDTVQQIVPADVNTEFQSDENALLRVALTEVDTRISLIDDEAAAVTTELNELATSIAATSRNAIALNALEREFANIQGRYDVAIRNLDGARRDRQVISARQGRKITIIEGANVPRDPTGPNRLRIAAIGIAAGLGLAAGFFALLEFTNRAIRRPVELESRFNVTPIAAIPYMETQRQKLLRRGILIVALLGVIIGVPALLWYIDTYYLPLELIVAKITSRLGL